MIMSSDGAAPPSYSPYIHNFEQSSMSRATHTNKDANKPGLEDSSHVKDERIVLNSNPRTKDDNDIYIAIMGVTGAGKSSLIAKLTKQHIKVGHDLVSCP